MWRHFLTVASLLFGGAITKTARDIEVFGQRFDANGTAVGDEFQVNTTDATVPRSSPGSRVGDGAFIVTWQS